MRGERYDLVSKLLSLHRLWNRLERRMVLLLRRRMPGLWLAELVAVSVMPWAESVTVVVGE